MGTLGPFALCVCCTSTGLRPYSYPCCVLVFVHSSLHSLACSYATLSLLYLITQISHNTHSTTFPLRSLHVFLMPVKSHRSLSPIIPHKSTSSNPHEWHNMKINHSFNPPPTFLIPPYLPDRPNREEDDAVPAINRLLPVLLLLLAPPPPPEPEPVGAGPSLLRPTYFVLIGGGVGLI